MSLNDNHSLQTVQAGNVVEQNTNRKLYIQTVDD